MPRRRRRGGGSLGWHVAVARRVPRPGPRPPGHPRGRAGSSPTTSRPSASTARSRPGGPGTFILESAEAAGSWDRYSFVGVRSRATLTVRDGSAVWVGDVPVGVPTDGDALDVLERTLDALRTPAIAGLPPLTSGLVGALGWDIVRHWEPTLPANAPDELGVPELTLLLATDLAVVDHHDGSVWLDRQRHQLRRHRRAGGRRARRRRRADRRDGGGAAAADRVRGRGPGGRRRARAGVPVHARRSSRTPCAPARRPSATATCSRWSSRSAWTSTARRSRSTSTGCCAPSTRARTCTTCSCRTPTAATSPSSGRARRRS